jgi:hypothetical protein|tara:strand:+ start:1113 stop:1502 length:390 start_codon:yes stop_codon:yes gene_type:complete
MTFTPVEIIALIVIIAGVIKMIVLLINPKAWMNFAKSVYSKPSFTSFVALVLAAVVLWYLIQSGITIVEVLAVSAFVTLLIAVGLAKEVGPLMKKYEAMIKKDKLWKEYWLYALAWILLMAWGVKELFF